jgi:hypothetical protein
MNRELHVAFVRHKAASMWINRVIAHAANRMGWRHEYFFESSRHGHSFSDFIERSRSSGKPFDIVTCADIRPDDVAGLPPFRAFHVIRDPRDAIVSAYFSHRNSHWFPEGSEAARHQKYLRSVPRDEGLLREIEFSARYIDRMTSWDFEQSQVLELKFEEITAFPYECFLEAFRFLDLLEEQIDTTPAVRLRRLGSQAINAAHARHPVAQPFGLPKRRILGEELLPIVYKYRFAKRSGGRAAGESDPHSPHRRGVAGDWENYFKTTHRVAFVEIYGDLVERLGYETSPEWRRVA